MTVTVGRIVHYRLTSDDIQFAQKQVLFGLASVEGEIVPLIVVHVSPDAFGDGVTAIDGQAFLNGSTVLWIRHRREGTRPGEWSWPPKV